MKTENSNFGGGKNTSSENAFQHASLTWFCNTVIIFRRNQITPGRSSLQFGDFFSRLTCRFYATFWGNSLIKFLDMKPSIFNRIIYRKNRGTDFEGSRLIPTTTFKRDVFPLLSTRFNIFTPWILIFGCPKVSCKYVTFSGKKLPERRWFTLVGVFPFPKIAHNAQTSCFQYPRQLV